MPKLVSAVNITLDAIVVIGWKTFLKIFLGISVLTSFNIWLIRTMAHEWESKVCRQIFPGQKFVDRYS